MASRLTQEEAERGLLAKQSPSINSGLNLDGALPTTLQVEAVVDGETHQWELRDDISSAVLMRGAELDRLQMLITAAIDEGDTDAALVAQARYDNLTDFIFLAIFKVSYPQEDVDLLRRAFDRLDRARLAMRFFAHRMNRPSTVSIAGESGPAAPRETATEGSGQSSGQSKAKKLQKTLGG